MTLNRRLGVLLKKKSAQLIGCIVLCMISVAFLIICMQAGKALEVTLNDFMDTANVEDANFITAMSIPDADIDTIEDTYDVVIEKMSFVDKDFNDTTIRVFSTTEKINGYALKEGSDLKNENDILLNDFYAENNEVEIGDTIELDGKSFTVAGYFTRVDYLTPVKDPSDNVMGTEFGIGIVSNEDFKQFNTENGYYSIVYNKDNDIEVRNHFHDNYTLMNYLTSKNNNRIVSAPSQATTVSLMAYMYGPFLFLLTAVFVMLVTSKILKNEKMEIGILSSLGYTKREIGVFYSKVALIISIVGGVLGIIVGQLLARPICEFYASINNCPNILSENLFNIECIVIAFLVPIVLLWATARLIVYRYMKKEVISLIRSIETKKAKRTNFLKKSKMSSGLKYSIRSVVRNKGRAVAFILGISIASAVTLMGLVMRTSIIYTVDVEMKQGTEYEYTYYLNSYSSDAIESGDGIVNIALEHKETGYAVNVIGVPDESEFFNVKTNTGKEPNYKEGFYISAVLAHAVGVNTGDTIMLINPMTTEEYSVEVKGILELNRMKTVYGSLENVNKLIGNEQLDAYNAIVSEEKLTFDEERVMQTLVNSEFVESLQSTLKRTMLSVANLLLFLGAIVGVIVVYMITSMTVEENQSNISMLKILGYTNKEISKMLFRVNKYFVAGFFVLMIYPIYKMCEMEFIASVNEFNLIIPAKLSVLGVLFAGALMIISYYLALIVTKKKVYKSDMVESLKKNRE